MTDEFFLDYCKKRIKIYYLDYQALPIDRDIKLVWFCKTIQNFKAIMFVPPMQGKQDDKPITINGKFIECSYNGDKDELYMDIYEKQNKKIYHLNSMIE